MAHSSHDVGVSAASADISRHGMLDVVVRRADRLLEQCDRAHDLAAGAVAALVSVVFHKSSLHSVQIARLSKAFDGGDLVAFVHHGKRKAAVHAAAVDVNRAGAALSVIAAFLGAGKVKALAQSVEQSRARVEIAQGVVLAIDAQRDVAGTAAFGLIRWPIGSTSEPQLPME